MRRATFARALVAALLALVVVAPPVAAETWQLEPPYAFTDTNKTMCCADGSGVAHATASPDGVITAFATAGGSGGWFWSSAEGLVGDSITWTPTSTSGDTKTSGKKTTTTTTTTETKTVTIAATVEITSVALVGGGSDAAVGIDGCGDHHWLAHEDIGKVITITCTLADMRSGDVVAVSAWASSADSTFGSWVQTGPSTASVDVTVKSISVSG